MTTENFEQASSVEQGFKCSQSHTNASITTSTTNTNTTITLKHDSTQHDNGLALCLRVILDSEAHRWVQAGYPRYTGARKGRPLVVHNLFHDKTSNKRQPTTTSLETNVLSGKQVQSNVVHNNPGADRHLESCMVAEHSSLKLPVLETADPRRSHRASWTRTPPTMSKRSPGSSSRCRTETKPVTPEKINQETEHIKQNETEHIKIPQNPYTDRVADVESAYARKESETRQSNLGWTSDTVIVNMCRLEKGTPNESSLRKFMNVSDMQVPGEDDHHDEQSRKRTTRS